MKRSTEMLAVDARRFRRFIYAGATVGALVAASVTSTALAPTPEGWAPTTLTAPSYLTSPASTTTSTTNASTTTASVPPGSFPRGSGGPTITTPGLPASTVTIPLPSVTLPTLPSVTLPTGRPCTTPPSVAHPSLTQRPCLPR